MERNRDNRLRLTILAGLALLVATAVSTGCRTIRRAPEARVIERGIASWYGPGFHGRTTANGERYDMHALTAAHPSLPFGTWVEIRNLDNGKTCRVRINDRGPFVRGRIVDLSYAAARSIDMVGPGTARVELAVVGPGAPRPLAPLEPDPVPVSAPVLAPEEPAAAPDAFTVQVGAFGEADRAETLRDLLATHYPDTRVASDGTWYRVQVGTFSKRPAADKLRQELERLGWTALVVAAR